MKKKEDKRANKIGNKNKEINVLEPNANTLPLSNEIDNKCFLLFDKQIINKKIIFKKDSITSTDNESDIPKSVPENLITQNFLPPFNSSTDNSAFKQNINNFPISSFPLINSFNYYLNISQTYPLNNIIPKNINFCPRVYDIPYSKNNNINKIVPLYKPVKESSNKFNLLNKKRNAESSNLITPKKVKIKTILNLNDKNEIKKEKKNLFEISYKNNDKKIINFFKIKKNREKIFCKHSGCDIHFKTKKQAIFHHFKMSPNCQDDTISLLKMIFETKKIALKSMEKNKKVFEKISKIYENSMKDISLIDYINIITGVKIKDKI